MKNSTNSIKISIAILFISLCSISCADDSASFITVEGKVTLQQGESQSGFDFSQPTSLGKEGFNNPKPDCPVASCSLDIDKTSRIVAFEWTISRSYDEELPGMTRIEAFYSANEFVISSLFSNGLEQFSFVPVDTCHVEFQKELEREDAFSVNFDCEVGIENSNQAPSQIKADISMSGCDVTFL